MEESKTISWTKQTLFAGLDLHKSKWVITVRTADLHLKTYTVPSQKEQLLASLIHLFPDAKVKLVYEAGCFGYHLAEYLSQRGIDTIIVSPQTIPVRPGDPVKTDKIDSRRLALELSKGYLKGIFHPTNELLQHRSLIRKRQQVLGRRVELQNQIKSDLLFYGIEIPTTNNGYWSGTYLAALQDFKFPDSYYQQAFQGMLAEYDYLSKRLKEINKLIVELSRTIQYRDQVTLLRTVPGIGILSAMTILLEIFDIRRFQNGDRFVSFVGLTPSEHSSGAKIQHGSLSWMGKKVLRTLFIEIAWSAIRKDPVLLEKFTRVQKGKSKTKAIVAVANSLARRVRRVLITQQPYSLGIAN